MTTTSRVRQPSLSKLDLRSSVISSSSTSDDFREYVGCSNCARDLVSNERKAKGHQRTTFWIFECGHISCAFCLGISDGIPDFGSEHTCPLPSCGESPSAIHQLTLGAPIHPTLSPFFESPRPQIERLKSNLGFQNLQMSLRIKNLRKLVEILQDSMMEAKSQLKDMRASKQEVMALKHEVRHLRKIIGDSQHGQSNLLHQFKDQNQDQSNPFDRATGLSEPVTAFDTRLQPEFQRPTISPLGNRRLSVPSNHPYLVKASEINSRRKTSSNSLWSHEQSVSAQNPDAKRKISPEHIRQYEFSSKKRKPLYSSLSETPVKNNHYESSLRAIPEDGITQFISPYPPAFDSKKKFKTHPSPQISNNTASSYSYRPNTAAERSLKSGIVPLSIPAREVSGVLNASKTRSVPRNPSIGNKFHIPLPETSSRHSKAPIRTQIGFTYRPESPQEWNEQRFELVPKAIEASSSISRTVSQGNNNYTSQKANYVPKFGSARGAG